MYHKPIYVVTSSSSSSGYICSMYIANITPAAPARMHGVAPSYFDERKCLLREE